MALPAALLAALVLRISPDRISTGDAIEGLDGPFPEGTMVFQAGTAAGPDGRVVTAGGRVLTVAALGDGLDDAARRAYEVAARVRFRGMQLRKDIGKK